MYKYAVNEEHILGIQLGSGYLHFGGLVRCHDASRGFVCLLYLRVIDEMISRHTPYSYCSQYNINIKILTYRRPLIHISTKMSPSKIKTFNSLFSLLHDHKNR